MLGGRKASHGGEIYYPCSSACLAGEGRGCLQPSAKGKGQATRGKSIQPTPNLTQRKFDLVSVDARRRSLRKVGECPTSCCGKKVKVRRREEVCF